jgi:hypothetical protein
MASIGIPYETETGYASIRLRMQIPSFATGWVARFDGRHDVLDC